MFDIDIRMSGKNYASTEEMLIYVYISYKSDKKIYINKIFKYERKSFSSKISLLKNYITEKMLHIFYLIYWTSYNLRFVSLSRITKYQM